MDIINTRIIVGLVLIVLGLIIFLGNMDIIDGDYTLFIIGGGLLLAYYLSGKKVVERRVGFLIAGMIVSMVAFFDMADNYVTSNLAGSLFFAFLGTAFLLIYLLHTMHINNGEQKWPFYVALANYAFSLFIYLVEVVDLRIVQSIVERYWPIIFIIIGVRILVKNLGSSKKTVDDSNKNNDNNKTV
ncbi:MAG: hypothetical protein ACLFPF_06815 [Halanaerobiales bacterium]